MALNTLLYRGQQQWPMHRKAKLLVFTVGARVDCYLQALQPRARLTVSHSTMVAAWLALSSIDFARMSIKPKLHLNHLRRRGSRAQRAVQFSMLANSGILDQDAYPVQLLNVEIRRDRELQTEASEERSIISPLHRVSTS